MHLSADFNHSLIWFMFVPLQQGMKEKYIAAKQQLVGEIPFRVEKGTQQHIIYDQE